MSRDYVIPLVEALDVPGPMGRSVTDVAILLTVVAGADENDAATEAAGELFGTDYTQFLTTDGVESMRVGYFIPDDAYREFLVELYAPIIEDEDQLNELADTLVAEYVVPEDEIAYLEAAGIQTVSISASESPSVDVFISDIIQPGFKYDVNAFLRQLGPLAPVASLEAVIVLNTDDPTNRAPYGQAHLLESSNTSVPEADYRQQVLDLRQMAAESINVVLETHNLDALLGRSYPYPEAGFPAITVPAGYSEDGEPRGMVIVGGYLSEPALIQIAYAVEQSSSLRVAPNLDVTISEIDATAE